MSGIDIWETTGMPTATTTITADRIETTEAELVLFVGGQERRVAWQQCSSRLAAASLVERMHAELSPSGYGIHWPLIDEDLTVAGLIRRLDASSASE